MSVASGDSFALSWDPGFFLSVCQCSTLFFQYGTISRCVLRIFRYVWMVLGFSGLGRAGRSVCPARF